MTSAPNATRIPQIIAAEIGASPAQVISAVDLLDGGATVPFIARYRKEVTGGLDDTQLRKLEERLGYLRELEARRAAISGSIAEQGKMTDALTLAIARAETKAELEDIYLPYKPKRRTRAMIAREAGLQGLVDAILADRAADPLALAGGVVCEGFADAKAALEGARDILAEGLATAALVSPLVGAPIWAMITLASAVLLRLRAFGWLPVALLGMATFGALTRTEIGSISLPFGAVSALLFRMALALQRPEAI